MYYYFKRAKINEWVELGFFSRTKGTAQIADNNGVCEGSLCIERWNKAQNRHIIITLTVTQDEVSSEQTLYAEKHYHVGRVTTIYKNKERVIEELKGYNALYHDFSKKDIEKIEFFINEMQGELKIRNGQINR